MEAGDDRNSSHLHLAAHLYLASHLRLILLESLRVVFKLLDCLSSRPVLSTASASTTSHPEGSSRPLLRPLSPRRLRPQRGNQKRKKSPRKTTKKKNRKRNQKMNHSSHQVVQLPRQHPPKHNHHLHPHPLLLQRRHPRLQLWRAIATWRAQVQRRRVVLVDLESPSLVVEDLDLLPHQVRGLLRERLLRPVEVLLEARGARSPALVVRGQERLRMRRTIFRQSEVDVRPLGASPGRSLVASLERLMVALNIEHLRNGKNYAIVVWPSWMSESCSGFKEDPYQTDRSYQAVRRPNRLGLVCIVSLPMVDPLKSIGSKNRGKVMSYLRTLIFPFSVNSLAWFDRERQANFEDPINATLTSLGTSQPQPRGERPRNSVLPQTSPVYKTLQFEIKPSPPLRARVPINP